MRLSLPGRLRGYIKYGHCDLALAFTAMYSRRTTRMQVSFWGAAMNSPSSSIPETGQEVRFAVAMSGGVSLAVWMGGVAREMNLLQQASNLRQAQQEPGSADLDDRCRHLHL